MDHAIYFVLNEELKTMESWRLSNVMAMLGLMVGTKVDVACIGHEIEDASGIKHRGIGNVVMPILSVKAMDMASFYLKSKEVEKGQTIVVFDFVLCAQNAKQYDDYAAQLKSKSLADQVVLGLAIYGERKACVSLCGSLPRWK